LFVGWVWYSAIEGGALAADNDAVATRSIKRTERVWTVRTHTFNSALKMASAPMNRLKAGVPYILMPYLAHANRTTTIALAPSADENIARET
jgi:hypothetical protein